MRIGMMADVYKPHVSGVTHYIALNKKHLEALGHEVYVFTFGDEQVQEDESRVIRSPGLPLMDTGYYLGLRYTSHARKLLTTMDVVHVHHPFLSGSLALRYCRSRGVGIVFTNHTRYDLYAKVYLPVLPDVIGLTAIQAYLPAFCKACDVVVAPSHGMKEVLCDLGVEVEVKVVPNGVDIHPFQGTVKAVDRSLFGFFPEDVVLIYTGRLGAEKNLPFLLRAFSGVAQAYPQVRLLIVGDGPERDNLIDRVHHMGLEKRVHITGMVPYENVPAYLACADAFVTASTTEVHPLSVIEAMAAGLPVLGIHSPGISDTVQDGITGFLAMEEDLAGFTAKMVRLVLDDRMRRQMGEQARRESQNYHIEKTVRMMLEVYQEAMDRAGARRRHYRRTLKGVLDRLLL